MSKAPPMNNTCSIVTVSRDRYGDYRQETSTASNCHLRYITTVRRGSNGEERQSDAMLWVPTDTDIDSGSIVKCDGTTFQVDRVTKARDLYSPTIHFLKCDLEIINLGVS